VTLAFDDLVEINRLRVMARVVSNAAHDVNNALQIIGGSAETLSTRLTIGPMEQRRVQSIAAQAERISTTLDLLSWVTRADDGGPQIVDLARLVDDAVALRAFSLGRAGVSIAVERPAGVPCAVSANRRRILQVCLNLLLNVEAALAKRTGASVQIRFENLDREWSVVFGDNGPGLGAGPRARLVDEAPPRPEPGLSGLGLWVSARIAAQYQGRLEVDDTKAAGTALRLRLPKLEV
jgi:signal transduction histidine kinase